MFPWIKLMQSKKPKSFSRFWLKESFANQTVFLHFWMLTIYFTLLNVFCITFNNMILMKANVRSWNLSALYNFFCYFWLFLRDLKFWFFDFCAFDIGWILKVSHYLISASKIRKSIDFLKLVLEICASWN